MKIKVSEATNNQLNWLVASTLGKIWTGDWYVVPMDCRFKVSRLEGGCVVCWLNGTSYRPTTSWEHGGPIIERERIATWDNGALHPPEDCTWTAGIQPEGDETANDLGIFALWMHVGPTPLIAAMRAYVASKLGEEVELP